jgi:hypothetical protein
MLLGELGFCRVQDPHPTDCGIGVSEHHQSPHPSESEISDNNEEHRNGNEGYFVRHRSLIWIGFRRGHVANYAFRDQPEKINVINDVTTIDPIDLRPRIYTAITTMRQ